jgi:hypothetical protein
MVYDLVGAVELGEPVVIQPGRIYGAGDLGRS